MADNLNKLPPRRLAAIWLRVTMPQLRIAARFLKDDVIGKDLNVLIDALRDVERRLREDK